MTWDIVNVTTSVTTSLPMFPKTIVQSLSADTQEYMYPGYHKPSMVISYGFKSRRLVIEGVLKAASLATLYSSYITPLTNCVDSICHINGGGARYHEDQAGTALNWICASFEFTLDGGFTAMAKYKMEFVLGRDSAGAYGGIIIA